MDYSVGTIVVHVNENWTHSTGVVREADADFCTQTLYYIDWEKIYDDNGSMGLSLWNRSDELMAISHVDFEDRIRDRIE